jgi:hypothetical protein
VALWLLYENYHFLWPKTEFVDAGDVCIVVEEREGIYNKGFIFFSNPYTSHLAHRW